MPASFGLVFLPPLSHEPRSGERQGARRQSRDCRASMEQGGSAVKGSIPGLSPAGGDTLTPLMRRSKEGDNTIKGTKGAVLLRGIDGNV